ncbi:MAG TPA: hypothetical protein VIZ68_01660 [Thermoplasmata archaeon]
MVNGALTLGGLVGVALSAAFVYWEVGRYAAPQVPRSLFDERKEFFAYTAGLFLGLPLVLVYLFFTFAVAYGAVIAALIYIAILVGATELAQWGVSRTVYFGASESTPFYLLGVRAGVAAILIVGAMSAYLSQISLTVDGVALALATSVALLAIQVNGALVSIRTTSGPRSPAGGPVSGVLVAYAAFLLLGLGAALGTFTGIAAALLVIGGIIPSYRRLRRRVLGKIRGPAEERADGERSRFGRTDS